ncbi:MAG: tetratricopeptide repeat protein [Vicinamibacterales bacterium]
MKAESIVFAIAGMCFGVILGWVLGTQQAAGPAAPVAAAAAAAQPAAAPGASQAPTLDEARVQQYQSILSSDPKNAGALVQLGNTYFDAQRYPDAIKYYQQSLEIAPGNVDASTDLGVSYYYSNQADEALKQFEVSLKLDPRHSKTLLNKGIVLAFGKQDLPGAAAAWNQVIEVAPGTPEAEAARRGLDGINASRGQGAAP